MKETSLKKIPLPKRRPSIPSSRIPSRTFSTQSNYSLPPNNSTLSKVDMQTQLRVLNINQISMNRKLIKIESRLGGIETRLGGIENSLGGINDRLNAIENNSITQTTILRSMEKLIKQICGHFNNNANVSENSSEKSNVSHSSTGTAIYKRRNKKP